MDEYPFLNYNHLDIYNFDNFILVAYPGYLALGQPNFNPIQNNLQFSENSYVKILPHLYKEWINVFKQSMKLQLKQSHAETPSTNNLEIILYESNLTVLRYKHIESLFIFELLLNLPTNQQYNFQISLTLYQFIELFKGIKTLYFVPFILSQPTNFIFQYFVAQKETQFLESLTPFNALETAQNTCYVLNITNSLFFYTLAEMMLRYKTDLLQNIRLYQLIP